MDSSHVLDRLDVSTGARRRAESEPFSFTLVAGGVRVTNHSYVEPSDHAYVVTMDDDLPVACECPADEYNDPACKHRLAVAIRTPVRKAAAANVIADGGVSDPDKPGRTTVSDPGVDASADAEDDPEWCECAALDDTLPCFECIRRGRKQLPSEK